MTETPNSSPALGAEHAESSPDVEVTVLMAPRDDGRKGYYGPPVELLCMDDGTVRWRYDG